VQPPQFFDESARPQDKDATIPVVVAAGQIAFSRRSGGFLGKSLDSKRPVETRKGCTSSNIAVTGVCTAWCDAEQHKPASFSHFGGSTYCRDKPGRIRDDVIRWHHHYDGVRIRPHGEQRRNGYGGSRVACLRLQQYGRGFETGALHLLPHEEAVVV